MIEIADEIDVTAKVFRLFSRDGTESCKRDLIVRFDCQENGWQVSFYSNLTNAIQCHKPMTSIPANVADLAIKAFQMLVDLREAGQNEI